MSNYPPGVTGNEPMIAGVEESESVQELECGSDSCNATYEVPTTETHSHGIVEWTASWVCNKCGESNTRDGWYDLNNNS
jgi:hypothetical protein